MAAMNQLFHAAVWHNILLLEITILDAGIDTAIGVKDVICILNLLGAIGLNLYVWNEVQASLGASLDCFRKEKGKQNWMHSYHRATENRWRIILDMQRKYSGSLSMALSWRSGSW